MLRNRPGFAATAAQLVPCSIGANTVVFTTLDAVLLRPLPGRSPERLVRMVQRRREWM